LNIPLVELVSSVFRLTVMVRGVTFPKHARTSQPIPTHGDQSGHIVLFGRWGGTKLRCFARTTMELTDQLL